ncbi:IS5 family transposase [Nitrosomonas sp. H1_AOB3]|uniref:IS5 family transposase n=1 Tax=Nitrosomonas sp. H1_AOB3 TaxID=2741553 RepID=UPI0019360733|nr:IS5 family transposase [Nitrosomonas sp. H1_AOB3]QOJ08993.1 MAG: IS5 family transposase [Nitrosomonas sp. H1_AOB3]
MTHSHRRHDISDRIWSLLEGHLPGREGAWGGVATDNRQFINAVFWIIRTGAPWRDLPPDYGGWSNTHRRFIRWRDKGIWEKLLEILIDDPDYEWLIMDASHCKVHPHASGARGGNQDMNRTKGLNTKIHLAVDAHGMPVRILVTQGTTADCTQAGRLIEGIDADHLLADRGYDSNAIVEQAEKQGMEAVIPPKKNRKIQRPYDKELYKLRHLVENAFLHLKRWRGIATRYAKNTSSFLAVVQIRCIALWADIL